MISETVGTRRSPLQEAIFWTDEVIQAQARDFADTVIKNMVIQQGEDGLYQTTWVGAQGVREKTADALRNKINQDLIKTQVKDLTAMYRKDPKAHYVGKTNAGSGVKIALIKTKLETKTLLTANEILLERRGALIDGVPRGMLQGNQEPTPAPLPEAKSEVYWKNVSSKHKVSTKDGKSFKAQMPDGPKTVDWKPGEEGEARKALSKLAGFKESRSLHEGTDFDIVDAIEAAARGNADTHFTHTLGGKKFLISSSSIKVQGTHLVLVTDPSSKPLGAPFYAGDLVRDPASRWVLPMMALTALVKNGGRI